MIRNVVDKSEWPFRFFLFVVVVLCASLPLFLSLCLWHQRGSLAQLLPRKNCISEFHFRFHWHSKQQNKFVITFGMVQRAWSINKIGFLLCVFAWRTAERSHTINKSEWIFFSYRKMMVKRMTREGKITQWSLIMFWTNFVHESRREHFGCLYFLFSFLRPS